MSEQTAEKDTAKATPSVHPLFAREVRPLYNWREWLSRWDAAVSMEEMLGLLHVGLSVSLARREYGEKEYDYIDRLMFYFSIADGWERKDLLENPKDKEVGHFPNRASVMPNELRQKIAQKAFDALCLTFFKEVFSDDRYSGDSFKDEWKKTIVSERLFPVIQNFFRAEKSRYSDKVVIRNLSWHEEDRSHNERQAVRFLLALARLIWDWREPHEPYYGSDEQIEKFGKESAARLSRVDASKPWLVAVLSYLDKLDLLRKREWLLGLDKPSLAKLKEIALRNELSSSSHPVAERRPVATMEEALYAGSKAALLLKEYEVVQDVHTRLMAIRDAERQRQKAERELEELTGRKK